MQISSVDVSVCGGAFLKAAGDVFLDFLFRNC